MIFLSILLVSIAKLDNHQPCVFPNPITSCTKQLSSSDHLVPIHVSPGHMLAKSLSIERIQDCGRSDRAQTCGLSIPNAALFQLSYTPIYFDSVFE